MNLQIGVCLDDGRTVNKTFTVNATITGQVKSNVDIINPVFIIATPSDININYCYCSDFNRYYYVDNVEVMTGGKVALNCRVDVLKSFANGIKDLNCIIDKQEKTSESNLYKDDGSFVMLNKAQNQVINFSNGLNDNFEYVLVVAGA